MFQQAEDLDKLESVAYEIIGNIFLCIQEVVDMLCRNLGASSS